MPLFPAYASAETEEMESCEGVSPDAAVSWACEARLLASDEEASPCSAKHPRLDEDKEYYLDARFDGANLPVTTLYVPGRPQYDSMCTKKTLGLKKNKKGRVPRGKWTRYYSSQLPSDRASVEAEVSVRAQALRSALADDPSNEELWIRHITFQERWAGAEGALRAADEAERAHPQPGPPLRAALLAARERHMPRRDYCAWLHAQITKERCPAAKLELWVRAVRGAGADAGPAAARALAQLRSLPRAYPHLLYAYGCWLRDAGLWELLTLLVELVGGVCFPGGGGAIRRPPHEEALDARLRAHEDKVVESGLPTHAVWARVETARAEAHWHAPRTPSSADELDPQRVPHPADVADLLLPVTDPDAALLLCAQLLRLAKVPPLPAGGATAGALSISSTSGDMAFGGEALLPLVRAARRLPAAHPARCGGAAVARRLVARLVDPPHYFSADNGYLAWVGALWDACCEWLAGDRRTALLCWRMRWWHALLLLLDQQEADAACGAGGAGAAGEARRVAAEARAALKRFGGASPLPFAMFARVHAAAAAAAAAAGGGAVALAARALRAAIADAACPPHHRLYVARIVQELDRPGGSRGAWALACAALARPLPADSGLEEPPPEELTLAALDECRRRCADLERHFSTAETAEEEPLCAALLPGPGEWLAALVALTPAAEPSPLPSLARLQATVRGAPAAARRYWEQGACAWAFRAARHQRQASTAHALAPLFPRNAYLALAGCGAPLWAWRRAEEADGAGAPHRSDAPEQVLALLLPHLLRAERSRWAPDDAARVAAACERCAGAGAGSGGALLWYARLEAEARAPRPRTHAALYGALLAHPDHKWVYVRGAALCPPEADALPDAMLERQLRLHALPDEVRPVNAPGALQNQ